MDSPTKDQALQFALMLKSGMPPADAIQYFFQEETDIAKLRAILGVWLRSSNVHKAVDQVQGKPWVDMGLQEQIQFAIDKHYAELAYFLYNHNYNDLQGAERQKADVCRGTLETKLAGLAGKMSPLNEWLTQVKDGRVKLPALPGGLPAPQVIGRDS